jgi:hypothetical protein
VKQIYSILMMDVTCSSETSVDFQRTAHRYIPKDRIFRLSTETTECSVKRDHFLALLFFHKDSRLQEQYTLTIEGVCACVTYKTGSGLNDWITDTLFTQFGTTGNAALSLIYTHCSSPFHTHYGSQSSLVVSWQRIYQSLTVTSNRI